MDNETKKSTRPVSAFSRPEKESLEPDWDTPPVRTSIIDDNRIIRSDNNLIILLFIIGMLWMTLLFGVVILMLK